MNDFLFSASGKAEVEALINSKHINIPREITTTGTLLYHQKSSVKLVNMGIFSFFANAWELQ